MIIHDNKRYILVYSTRDHKEEKPMAERVSDALEDIELANQRLREHLKQLKPLNP